MNTNWPPGWIIHGEREAHDPILQDECRTCLRAEVARLSARSHAPSIALLAELLGSLPQGHPERAGIVRSIELLRVEG